MLSAAQMPNEPDSPACNSFPDTFFSWKCPGAALQDGGVCACTIACIATTFLSSQVTTASQMVMHATRAISKGQCCNQVLAGPLLGKAVADSAQPAGGAFQGEEAGNNGGIQTDGG